MKLFRQKESYISEKMKLYGNIDTETDLSVDGEIQGNIRAAKHVMLGDTSRFEGNIECDTAMICGYFKGRIVAKRLLEVKIPATIVGDLISESVKVDSGVAIQGKIFAKIVEKEYLPAATVTSDNVYAAQVGPENDEASA